VWIFGGDDAGVGESRKVGKKLGLIASERVLSYSKMDCHTWATSSGGSVRWP
jgi:hypothetical protein